MIVEVVVVDRELWMSSFGFVTTQEKEKNVLRIRMGVKKQENLRKERGDNLTWW